MRAPVVILVSILTSSALADQPAFVPFTVTEDDLKALNTQIEELPIKTMPAAQAVGRWISGLEQKAVAEKVRADDAAKIRNSGAPK